MVTVSLILRLFLMVKLMLSSLSKLSKIHFIISTIAYSCWIRIVHITTKAIQFIASIDLEAVYIIPAKLNEAWKDFEALKRVKPLSEKITTVH